MNNYINWYPGKKNTVFDGDKSCEIIPESVKKYSKKKRTDQDSFDRWFDRTLKRCIKEDAEG